jgi:hypothetical protein
VLTCLQMCEPWTRALETAAAARQVLTWVIIIAEVLGNTIPAALAKESTSSTVGHRVYSAYFRAAATIVYAGGVLLGLAQLWYPGNMR